MSLIMDEPIFEHVRKYFQSCPGCKYPRQLNIYDRVFYMPANELTEDEEEAYVDFYVTQCKNCGMMFFYNYDAVHKNEPVPCLKVLK